eukprot:1692818-Amphidinium_carterae.1
MCRFHVGTWCSGITSASHAENPGLKSLCWQTLPWEAHLQCPMPLLHVPRLQAVRKAARQAHPQTPQLHLLGLKLRI